MQSLPSSTSKNNLFHCSLYQGLKIVAVAMAFMMLSCGSSEPKCAMGDPTPIFKSNLTDITGHTFKKDGQKSTETFDYKGESVAIYQSGCEAINQEYQFTFKDKTNGDQEGMLKVARILAEWSSLDPSLGGFLPWSQQINMVAPEMHMGASFNPNSDIEIGIDKVNVENGEIIKLNFKQGKDISPSARARNKKK